MSTAKKVFFLFILFIILCTVCVYNHTNGFNFSPKIIQSIENEQVVQNEEATQIKEEVEKEPEPQETVEEEKVEEVVEVQEQEIDSQAKVVEIEEKIEEVEEVIEPLLTTDKRYTREENQKYIEDMSIETQKLQIEINEFVKKNPIVFKSSSDKIRKTSNIAIKKISKILKDNPNIKIEVAGHTDASGPEKLNLLISQQRADSVKNRLAYYGIEKSKIVARGYGEIIPLIKKKGYSIVNRRVEFNILEE